MNKITAYTDGSAVLNYPFKGGFGIYIKTSTKSFKIRKGYCNTKTGRMELRAVLTCLKSIKNKNSILTIYSDSMYVINTCNEWIFKWENQGWFDKKNVDLLEQLIIEIRKFKKRPILKHIKGHQEVSKNNPDIKNKHIEGNCTADSLANYKTQKSWELDLPLNDKRVIELDLTEIEKQDFKEINGKIYFKQDE